MVIARNEWFEGKEGSYLERYDVTWQGAIYMVVMWFFPIILIGIFLQLVLVDIRNMNLIIMSLAWLIFSFADILDSDIKDSPKPFKWKENGFRTAEINTGWITTPILIVGALISINYNIYSWNFYLGLFATTAFVACIVIAITKYKFKKREIKMSIDGE